MRATTLPSWLSFDAGTRTFSERQPIAMLVHHSVVLTATDAADEADTQSFTIAVTNTNDAPTLANAISDQTVAEDSALSFQFASDVFADVDAGDSFTYTATLSDDEARFPHGCHLMQARAPSAGHL